MYYAGVNDEAQEYDRMLKTCGRPVGLISIEDVEEMWKTIMPNMRGISIKNTRKYRLALHPGKKAGIPTFGVGDGGNEIEWGNLKGSHP